MFMKDSPKAHDFGVFMRVGTKVVCRGALAHDFSLEGEVEMVIPECPRGVYEYGVRLVNGNYKLFFPQDVRRA